MRQEAQLFPLSPQAYVTNLRKKSVELGDVAFFGLLRKKTNKQPLRKEKRREKRADCTITHLLQLLREGDDALLLVNHCTDLSFFYLVTVF